MTRLILLVDDHDANRSVLRRRLERRGYAVVEAADGEEAVAKFCEAPPDVVLMDLSMPNVSGFEALERLRASGRGQHVPVVAVTAHALESIQRRCADAGFAGFYTKPLDFESFVAGIETTIGKSL